MASLPSGAASTRKAIQRAIPWLQGYEEIVLFFDNDEAGRKRRAIWDAKPYRPDGIVEGNKPVIVYAASMYDTT